MNSTELHVLKSIFEQMVIVFSAKYCTKSYLKALETLDAFIKERPTLKSEVNTIISQLSNREKKFKILQSSLRMKSKIMMT